MLNVNKKKDVVMVQLHEALKSNPPQPVLMYQEGEKDKLDVCQILYMMCWDV